MRRLFLSAGHSDVKGKDRGAVSGQFVEGELAADFRRQLAFELQQLNVNCILDNDSNVTGDTVRLFRGLVKQADVAIDIHFNAAGFVATGTEIIIPDKSTKFENEVSKEIAKIIGLSLGIRNRGVKPESYTPRKKLFWMVIPCENILIEVCFLTNKTDMEKYLQNKELLAKNLANYLKSIL